MGTTAEHAPVAFDHLELWVGNIAQTRYLLSQGFGLGVADARLDVAEDEEALCLVSGGVTVVVRQGTSPSGRIARHVARHGDTVADVALTSADPAGVEKRARAYGLQVSVRGGRLRVGLSPGGGISHSVRPEPLRVVEPAGGVGPPMASVDHVAYCLPYGATPFYAQAYEEVFGLGQVDTGGYADVGYEKTGMRTTVLRGSFGLTVILTEPAAADGTGQTQRFLDAHHGPGVQHVAIAYDDLLGAVETLRARQVVFLPVPPAYFDEARRRLGDDLLPWDDLRHLEVLVDADDQGHLLQLFTYPITGRPTFFLELIQRAGATGFGAKNVRALFAALHAAIAQDPPAGGAAKGGATAATPSDRTVAEVRRVVERARDSVPFYCRHLSHADITSLGDLPSFHKGSLAGCSSFPLSGGGAAGAYRTAATSGTAGERLHVAFDRPEWERLGAWLESVAWEAGLRGDDVLLNTHGYGLWIGGPALDLLTHRAGACLFPLGPSSPGSALKLLAEGSVTALAATPSYLRRLVEAADVAAFDLSATGLRLGFVGGEPAEDPMRRRLLERLPPGFRWIELYGLTEAAGPSVAYGPLEVPELWLNTDDFVVEVLQLDDDVQVATGQVGELTLTVRHADCRTPLVRYRTRDLAQVLEAAGGSCTRISRILGRVDDALKVRGVLIYPSSLGEIVSEVLPLAAEWRATVHRQPGEHDELTVEVEANGDVAERLGDILRERLGLRVTVRPAPPRSLPRSDGKTRRVTIEAPLD